ncbi:MAG TPA: hypothetical protein VH592_17010 [Gemmataceae bacterium]|jgi:hypothetical protein
MRYLCLMLSLSALLLDPVPAEPADLTKIDRSLKKEPAYKGKPRYGLLVFGREAKTRVWLAIDGDTLYVDRNGNGDLTDAREQVPCTKQDRSSPYEMSWFFVGGTGPYTHLVIASWALKPELVKSKEDEGYVQSKRGQELGRFCRVWVETGGHGQYAGFLLADQPEKAPISHFGGPLTMLPPEDLTLCPGKEVKLSAWVGTRGLGSNRDGKRVRTTTSSQPYERDTGASTIKVSSIPADLHPIAEISFPNRQAEGKPIKITVVLQDRC